MALLWVNALSRKGITNAADRIDRELREDGHLKGLDTFGDRYLVEAPLAVVYAVSVDDRLIQVVQVLFVGY